MGGSDTGAEETSRMYRETPPQPYSYPDLHTGELLRTLF
jgi:hypothetical protein